MQASTSTSLENELANQDWYWGNSTKNVIAEAMNVEILKLILHIMFRAKRMERFLLEMLQT